MEILNPTSEISSVKSDVDEVACSTAAPRPSNDQTRLCRNEEWGIPERLVEWDWGERSGITSANDGGQSLALWRLNSMAGGFGMSNAARTFARAHQT
ncbi:hypothetical protein D9M68_532990 [compost metagenome]